MTNDQEKSLERYAQRWAEMNDPDKEPAPRIWWRVVLFIGALVILIIMAIR